MRTGATFRLWHDAGDITGRLGVTPTSATGTLWTLTSAAPESVELADHLTWLLDRLEPVRDVLWQLVNEGCAADWFCLAASRSTEHAVELDRALLARLLRLPGDLLIDAMGDDD